MTLYVVPKLRTDASDFVENARRNALDMFDPTQLGYCGDHFFHLCREVSSEPSSEKNHSELLAYGRGCLIS